MWKPTFSNCWTSCWRIIFDRLDSWLLVKFKAESEWFIYMQNFSLIRQFNILLCCFVIMISLMYANSFSDTISSAGLAIIKGSSSKTFVSLSPSSLKNESFSYFLTLRRLKKLMLVKIWKITLKKAIINPIYVMTWLINYYHLQILQ